MSVASLMKTDQQSSVDRIDVDVIYDGPITFWQSRLIMDAVIAMHRAFNMIEFIVHDSKAKKEASRLYIGVSDIIPFIDTTKIDESLQKISEQRIRQCKDFNQAKEARLLYNEVIAKYLVNKAHIERVGEGEDVLFVLKLQTGEDALEQDRECPICRGKPENLVPFPAAFKTTVSVEAISAVQNELKDESEALKSNRKLAELLTNTADGFNHVLSTKRSMDKKLHQFSRPRRRWIWAINKVLVNNYVEKTRTKIKASSLTTQWYINTYGKDEEKHAAGAKIAQAPRYKQLWNQKQLERERRRILQPASQVKRSHERSNCKSSTCDTGSINIGAATTTTTTTTTTSSSCTSTNGAVELTGSVGVGLSLPTVSQNLSNRLAKMFGKGPRSREDSRSDHIKAVI